jgi:chloride channel 3/4/5
MEPKSFRGRLLTWLNTAKHWVLIALVGCLTAIMAYIVDISEAMIFDYKYGFCRSAFSL